MKRTLAIAFLTATSFAAIGGAHAQDHGVQATVPFEFTVGGKLLPADTYRVTETWTGLLTIQSTDHRHIAQTVATQGNPEINDGRSKLVFSRCGGQYFLHNIVGPSSGMNAALPTSKVEKRVRMEQVRLITREEVVVAAK